MSPVGLTPRDSLDFLIARHPTPLSIGMGAERPTKDETAWMRQNRDETRIPDIISATTICGVGSAVLIILRLLSRHFADRRLGLDDLCVLIAWVLYVAFCVCLGAATDWGYGHHMILVTDAASLGKITIAMDCIYLFSMAMAKFSILSLYYRVFPQRWLNWSVVSMTVLIASWLLYSLFTTIFQCRPLARVWDPSITDGTCIDTHAAQLASGLVNVLTDFGILLLPVLLTWKLDLSRQDKWLLIFSFSVGGATCIVALIRLAYVQRDAPAYDPSWSNADCSVISTAELFLCIFAVCLPSYHALYERVGALSAAWTAAARDALGRGAHDDRSRRNKQATSESLQLQDLPPPYVP